MPPLLFDIDETLFNSKKFLDYVLISFSRILKIPHGKIVNTVRNYYDTLSDDTKFIPEDFVKFIAKSHNSPKNLLWENFWNDKDLYLKSIYPNTIKALRDSSDHFSLGTFSQGILDFQKHKLEMLGIINFFEPELIFVSDNKTSKDFLKNLPKNSFIVEDRVKVIEKLSDFKPIWINRNSDEKDPRTPTIHSLSELNQLLF